MRVGRWIAGPVEHVRGLARERTRSDAVALIDGQRGVAYDEYGEADGRIGAAECRGGWRLDCLPRAALLYDIVSAGQSARERIDDRAAWKIRIHNS